MAIHEAWLLGIFVRFCQFQKASKQLQNRMTEEAFSFLQSRQFTQSSQASKQATEWNGIELNPFYNKFLRSTS